MHRHSNQPFGWRGPRGSYYGRGNVKFVILELLKERPRHGYDIMKEMEERSGGVYSPSPGVIYPTLQALEDQDYVKVAEQEGKKVYSITESGIAYLQGHQERQRTRHSEGFRPPFGPGPFGPGRRGEDPVAGRTAESAPGSGPEGAADGQATTAGAGGEGQPKQPPRGEGPHGPDGPNWIRTGPGGSSSGRGSRGRSHHAPGGAWGAWFASSGGPEMMREVRWMFGDVASAVQRTLGDPQKLKEIREVLREAKIKIDEIVMREEE